MTNNWMDIGNSTCVVVMGANPSENHPACMAHINQARAAVPKTLPGGQTSNKPPAELWVIDPRKTRTAALADRFIRIRPGTDIAFINGVVSHIVESLETGSDFTANQRANMAAFLNQSAATAWRADNGNNAGTVSRSKYTDARLIVNADGTDYDRALHETSTGTVMTNFPRAAATYNGDPQTVFNRLRAHVAHYTPAKAAEICGCSAQDIIDVARKFVDNSRCSSFNPAAAGTIIGDPTSQYYRSTTMLYAMGLTQHSHGSQNVKAFAVLQLLLGNTGRAGGGINALRGIHNVQGSTDMGVLRHLIPGYSANPSVQPYEDANAFGKYMDGLWGIRLNGATRGYLALTSTTEVIKYSAKTAGTAGNSITVEYVDPGVFGPLSVGVAGNAITVTLAHNGTVVTSTAADVAAAVNAFAAASALVGAVVRSGDGALVVGAKLATALAGGVDATYNSAYPAAFPLTNMALQQYGFYNMTRRWFGETSNFDRGDVDKFYSLWPKVNGTHHIQMFRNMADAANGFSEARTFGVPSGTVTLTKKGIKAGSISITGSVEGVDFKVSYPTGVITRIATGNIPAGATVTVTYDYGIRACVVWGQNPAVTEPNQSKVRQGLYNLDLLVVTDLFATETAQCDRKPGGVTYLLPASSYVEKAGSSANSGRVLQWRYAAKAPRGNSRSDMFLLFKLAKALDAAGAFSHFTDVTGDDATTVPTSGVWSTLNTPKNGSVYRTLWKDQYSFDEALFDAPATAAAHNEAVAENVYKEIGNGVALGGTLWIYTDAWADPATAAKQYPTVSDVPQYPDGYTVWNRAKSRNSSDHWGTLGYQRWGYSWLVNRRVLYNNGDVHRAGTTTTADQADGYQTSEKCGRLFVPTNAGIIDYADSNWRTIHRLADVPKTPAGANPAVHVHPGRFPSHTEPYETPEEGYATTYGYNSAGTAGDLLLAGTPRGTKATYPLVLTTIRCVEHFQGGPITRNNPANHEVEPEPWIEINSVDARTYGIADGDWVKIITARTDGYLNDQLDDDPNFPSAVYGMGFRARVGAGIESNQRVGVGVVAIPWHWGERGLSKGSRANDLCIDAMDPNTQIPEYKACLCRIVGA